MRGSSSALVGEQIDFVEEQEDWGTRFFRQFRTNSLRDPISFGVDNEENQFATFERFTHLGHHLRPRTSRLMTPECR